MARQCTTEKKHFRNYGDALNHMRDLNRRNPTTSKLRNVYECPLCSSWHMTSQPRHGHRLAMGKRMLHIEMDDIVSAAFELRSEQLIDASVLRAPVSRIEKTRVVIGSARRKNRSSLHPSTDRELAPGA